MSKSLYIVNMRKVLIYMHLLQSGTEDYVLTYSLEIHPGRASGTCTGYTAMVIIHLLVYSLNGVTRRRNGSFFRGWLVATKLGL